MGQISLCSSQAIEKLFSKLEDVNHFENNVDNKLNMTLNFLHVLHNRRIALDRDFDRLRARLHGAFTFGSCTCLYLIQRVFDPFFNYARQRNRPRTCNGETFRRVHGWIDENNQQCTATRLHRGSGFVHVKRECCENASHQIMLRPDHDTRDRVVLGIDRQLRPGNQTGLARVSSLHPSLRCRRPLALRRAGNCPGSARIHVGWHVSRRLESLRRIHF